jgi:ABC-type sugar transport system ATPase subunit
LGAPGNIYDEPANLFVARFMGTPPMNIIEADMLTRSKDGYKLQVEKDPEDLLLGIRPEHLEITDAEKGIFRASVNLVGSQGNERMIYLGFHDQEIIAREYGEVDLREGQEVGVKFENINVFVFAKTDGKRLK